MWQYTFSGKLNAFKETPANFRLSTRQNETRTYLKRESA